MSLALSVTQASPTCTEHELVAAVRRGSDRAFEELYARYHGKIGSYVFGMVGDHQRAEDIAQEVFISALRRLRDTERPIAFKPWIYEIAKNACIDEFRRTRRAREVPLENDDDEVGSGHRLVGHGVDAAVENKQRLDDLRGAFHGLSESHHRIIVMREFEGLSYSQIGERMGMSKPVVESTLFRARRRLGEEYDELVSGRRCERVQTVIGAEGERSLRSLGLKDRRQLARHLAHCQPCRRYARMAGVEDSFFKTPGLASKIAAILPIPWLRWRRSAPSDEAAAGGGSHSIAALQTIRTVAPLVDPSGPAAGLGRAAATAAAIVVAGVGGSFATGIARHGEQMPLPSQIRGAGAPPSHAAAAGPSTRGAASSSPASWNRAGAASASARAQARAHHSGGPAAGGASGAGRLSSGGVAGAGTAAGTHASAGGAGGSASGNAGSAGGISSVIRHPVATAGAAAGSLPGVGGSGSSGSGLPTPQLPNLPVPNLPQPPTVTLPPLPSNPLSNLPTPTLPKVSVPKLP